jgi:hypothetical protein
MKNSPQSSLPPSKSPKESDDVEVDCKHEYPLVSEEGRLNIVTGYKIIKWSCQLCEEVLETTYCDKDGRPLLLD